MKWKRVCMPCYNASVPRRGQSKKIVFLQNADKEVNSTMRNILSTDSNVSYFHSAYKGEVGFTALATLLPIPPPPPKKKKKNKKKRLQFVRTRQKQNHLAWLVDCQQSFGYFYCICLQVVSCCCERSWDRQSDSAVRN